MTLRIWGLASALALALTTSVFAQPAPVLDLVDGFVYAPLAGRPMTGGFGTLVNHTGDTLRIVSARSPVSKVVELHEMVQADGAMKMRRLEALDVAPHASRQLRPGSDHLMFIGITAPVTPGEMIDVVLVLQDGREVATRLPVRAREGVR